MLDPREARPSHDVKEMIHHGRAEIIAFVSKNFSLMPGDIIVADDDGVVLVPIALAPEVAEKAGVKHEWEDFTRMRLSQGGDGDTHWPLAFPD